MELEGLPAELVAADLDASSVHLWVDAAVYPLEALYGACFTFLDRCFVLIDRNTREGVEGACYRVVLRTRKPAEKDALEALVGSFANELLACAWREKLATANRSTLEAVTAQAIGGAMGPPSLDELEEFDFSEEPFEDPLGIAMSWEEKYGKKTK